MTPTVTPTATPARALDRVILAQGFGGNTAVRGYNRDKEDGLWKVAEQFLAMPPWLFGGVSNRSVNTAVGDVDGDGTRDVICGFGPGGKGSDQPSMLVVMRMANTANIIAKKGVFAPSATNLKLRNPHGALNVAAGNFTGDGLMIAAAQGIGGDNQIRMLRYTGGALEDVGTFRGLQQESLWGNSSGGISLAAGDIDGDGRDELVVGQMNGGMNVWNLKPETYIQVLKLKGIGAGLVTIDSYTASINAFPESQRGLGGVNLAVGDVNGDGEKEVIVATAGNTGEDSFLRVFDSALNPMTSPLLVIGAQRNPSGGLSVACANLDGDVPDEVLIGSQAIINLDMNSGVVTFTNQAPASLVVGLDFDGSKFTELFRIQPVAPASNAINVSGYPHVE
jgi:hypothetical protein